MKRLLILTTLLLVILAVPASAASWRTYGSARSNGGNYASIYTTARNVEDFQLGIYTYGSSKIVDWDGSWYCYNSNFGSTASRSKSGTVRTTAHTWKWINIRASSTSKWECSIDGSAYPGGGSVKIKLRVR